MITGDANEQDYRDDHTSQGDGHGKSLRKNRKWSELLFVTLVLRKKFHRGYSVGNCVISPGLRSILLTSPRCVSSSAIISRANSSSNTERSRTRSSSRL